MGCSSSRPGAKKENSPALVMATGVPKDGDIKAGDLLVDGDGANTVEQLLLKRSQLSMEGRQNQVCM